MPDLKELGRVVADTLAANPDQKSIEVSTSGMTGREVGGLIDAIYDACAAAGVTVKGVKVDPMQHPLPPGAEYINAYIRNGRLIVVDLDVDDKVVVRRK
ncbi:hypothetical protein ACF3NX_13055 (plasmid) [Acetobacter orientalis]|uniref:hypothetical protein n=1 Tax=Acetobacter orientalis TaxID=146474 RepID=UPI003868D752